MHVAARRIGQPGAVGEIVAGLMLGPSLLGHLLPDLSAALFDTAPLPLAVISQLGLILLMFQIGADFELGHLRDRTNRRAVAWIASGTLAVPLALGVVLGWISAPILAPGIDRVAYALFIAVALAITAVPILGRIMREFELTRTRIGAVTITSAAINDVVGWILLGGISAYVAARFSATATLLQIGGIALLVGGILVIGRRLVAWLLKAFPPIGDELPPTLMAAVLALTFGAAMATYQAGIFAIFGGFLIGTLFHDRPGFVAAWRRQVGQFVLVFFLPIFFTYTGVRTDIGGLATATEWLWLGLLLTAAVAGKMVPAYLACRACGLGSRDAATVGVLMNTRALMELVVLNVGYDLGVIPTNVFTMLVIVAVATTVMTAPLLRRTLAVAGRPAAMTVEA